MDSYRALRIVLLVVPHARTRATAVLTVYAPAYALPAVAGTLARCGYAPPHAHYLAVQFGSAG